MVVGKDKSVDGQSIWQKNSWRLKMKIKCNKCQYEWETKSKHVYVSCPSCMSKILTNQQVNKDSSLVIVGDEIRMKNKKFKINPNIIYQAEVGLNIDKEAHIRACKKHIGKKVTVIVDKEDSTEPITDKDWKRMANDWAEHS